MSFKLEITAENPSAFAEQLMTLALMLAPKLRNAPVAEAAEPETVDEPKKPRRASKKNDTVIEHDPQEGKKDVRVAATGAPADKDGTGAEVSAGDAPGDVGSASEKAADDKAADVDAVAEPDATPSMTIDELRAYTISNYLNVAAQKMEDRKNLYKALLDQYDIQAITALPVEKIDEFKAVVDAKIAEAAKK